MKVRDFKCDDFESCEECPLNAWEKQTRDFNCFLFGGGGHNSNKTFIENINYIVDVINKFYDELADKEHKI